jgi:pimeloyl-ACP methyl ester carboxylesterase
MSELVTRDYARISDGQVHYRRRTGTGTPIVFIHQTASSSRMWLAVMALLPPDRDLWAFDTPGFGASFKPDRAPGMDDYVEWWREMITIVGHDKVHLVGHHTGSAIALGIAAAYPLVVESLMLSGPCVLDAHEREHFRRKLGAAFKPGRSGAYLLQNWEYLRVGGAGDDVALLHREMIDQLESWEARPHAYLAVWTQDQRSILPLVKCRLALLSATDDVLYPYFDRARALRPDAVLFILQGGANFAPDLRPAEFAKAVEKFCNDAPL